MDRQPSQDLRVGLMASGGLSHFQVDEEMDRGLLEALKRKDIDHLAAMDPRRYIAVMENWLSIFTRGPVEPMYGVTEAQLASIAVPTVVIPGNDRTHSMAAGRAIQRLIPGSRLVELPLQDQDAALIPFSDWAPHEEAIARACAGLVKAG